MTITPISAWKTPDGKIWEHRIDAEWHEAENDLGQSQVVKALMALTKELDEFALVKLLVQHRGELKQLLEKLP